MNNAENRLSNELVKHLAQATPSNKEEELIGKLATELQHYRQASETRSKSVEELRKKFGDFLIKDMFIVHIPHSNQEKIFTWFITHLEENRP